MLRWMHGRAFKVKCQVPSNPASPPVHEVWQAQKGHWTISRAENKKRVPLKAVYIFQWYEIGLALPYRHAA